MTLSYKTLCIAFIFFVYLIIYFFSPFHNFNLWDQVVFLRGIELKFDDIFSQAHLLRYLLVLPIFYISDTYLFDADALFEVVCFLSLAFITRNCVLVSTYYVSNKIIFITFSYLFIFILVSVFMNGRIIYSFAGYSFLLLSIHRWEFFNINNINFLISVLISLILCSVSTGTFLSCIALLLVWCFTPMQNRKKTLLRFNMMILFLIISPVILLYLFKNINYYGGGIDGFFNMFQHGLGIIFTILDKEIISLLLLNTLIIGMFFLFYYFKKKNRQLLMLIIATALFSGLFGYSTLSLSIIPLSLTFLLILIRFLARL